MIVFVRLVGTTHHVGDNDGQNDVPREAEEEEEEETKKEKQIYWICIAVQTVSTYSHVCVKCTDVIIGWTNFFPFSLFKQKYIYFLFTASCPLSNEKEFSLFEFFRWVYVDDAQTPAAGFDQ